MSPNDDLSKRDTSPLLDSAIAAHLMFTAYVNAGFTEKQAIQLVAAQIAAATTGTEPPVDS